MQGLYNLEREGCAQIKQALPYLLYMLGQINKKKHHMALDIQYISPCPSVRPVGKESKVFKLFPVNSSRRNLFPQLFLHICCK